MRWASAPPARARLTHAPRSCGYHVTTADGGNAALALLRADGSAFDIVLSDVQMPDVDGFRLMELVALELDVPVISARP